MSFKEFDQSVRDATRHLLETPPQPYETVEEHVQDMISSGYWAKDCTPIKCVNCEGTSLSDRNHYYDAHFVVEYKRICNTCHTVLGVWAYGDWGIL